jgi:photosystem II stability/assembly factor-like uncharacterized protein
MKGYNKDMKHNSHFFWPLGLLLVALACLLSACGNTTTSNPTTATSTAQTAGNTTATAPSSTTATAPSSTGTQAVSTTTGQVTVLPTRPLTHIRMTDAMHGWALDQDNVLKTSDGGKSWVALTPNGALVTAVTDVDFLSAQYAWFVMPNTNGTLTIFSTVSGGATWHDSVLRENAPDGGLLSFITSTYGWFEAAPEGAGAGSEAVDIFQTSDGGATWNKVSSSGSAPGNLPTGGIKSGLSFKNALTGWATGEDASNTPWFYVTHDGGKSWSKQVITGIASGSTGYQTQPPVFIGNEDFLPMTVGASGTVLVRSNDGGNTWSASGQATGSFQSSNLYVVNTQVAYATDQNSGDFFRTQNAGKTWQKVATNTSLYGPLSFIDANTGFATGRADQVLLKRSDDGGNTWQNIAYQIHG